MFRNWDFRGLFFGKTLGVKLPNAGYLICVAISCGSNQVLTGLRFRVFRRQIIAKTDKFKSITKAVVALHNYLMTKRTQNNEITITIN